MKLQFIKMKYILIIPAIALLLFACQKEISEEPETLEEYNQLLTEKKQELKDLESEISRLSDKVAELDPSLQEKSKLVDTSVVTTTDFTRYINIQGSIVADDPVNAVSEIAGRINNLYVSEGDYVQKGKLIATIDVEGIQKQMNEINTSLELARDVYQRQERLWKQNIGSEVQYLQAKNDVDRLEKSLETFEFQLTKSNVYAPESGAIDVVMLQQGEVASPGMPIVQILNTSNLKVTTDLPENYLKIVRRGMDVQLKFPSIGIESTGKVTLLGRKIDPTNRTLEVEIKPRTSSKLFKPNLLAEIKIKELESASVITIPLEYILQEVDGTEFVYVAAKADDGNYRAQKRYVTIGDASEGSVIITDGLTPGESVIFRGARNVSNGELIEFSK